MISTSVEKIRDRTSDSIVLSQSEIQIIMETTDWIAVCSMVATVLLTTVGSALCLSFKIGRSNEKIAAMSTSSMVSARMLPN